MNILYTSLASSSFLEAMISGRTDCIVSRLCAEGASLPASLMLLVRYRCASLEYVLSTCFQKKF